MYKDNKYYTIKIQAELFVLEIVENRNLCVF